MDKREQISEEMFELGKKFSQLAKESGSAKQAKTAFDLACRAFKLVLQAEPEKPSDLSMAFLAGVGAQMLRSDLWRQYLDYCTEHDCIPLTKKLLFQRMDIMDFETTRKTEGFVIKPPAKQITGF